MKMFMALCLSLVTSVGFACTDFSGKYQDASQNIYIAEQSGCESITLINEERSTTYVADGQFRTIGEEDIATISVAAAFINDTITLDYRIQYKIDFPSDVPTDIIPVRLIVIYTKDASGDITVTQTSYNAEDGVIEGMVTHAVKI